jgi:beta-galactoside alpha-2,3-sialyltransferase (sialyltransferase 4A)
MTIDMTWDVKPKVFRRLALFSAAVLIFIFLVPQRVTAQEGLSPNLDADPNLETSVSGPLQRRLEKAFPDSFKTGVDIFWEARDGWVSPGVFDWWVRSVEDDGRQELSWEDAQGLFRVYSAQSRVFSIRPRRRICAVVGASHNLIDSHYGELIDAHDVVIRVNQAPTAGFESDVGVKTTHHVMWPKELAESEFDRKAFLLMTPINAGAEDVFGRIRDLVEECLRWEPGRVRIIHPEFVKYLHDNWTKGRGAYPSTGFVALMLAVHVCDEVDVFGFGADATGRWDHYYSEGLGEVVWFHPSDVEGRLRRELEEKGTLKVFRGSRPDVGLPTLEEDSVTQDAGGMPDH